MADKQDRRPNDHKKDDHEKEQQDNRQAHPPAEEKENRREVQAVVERLEEGLEESLYAVLLVGDAEEELILPAHRLPQGAQEGSWLRLTLQDDRVISLVLDEETTRERRARISAKRAKLQSRSRRFTPRSE